MGPSFVRMTNVKDTHQTSVGNVILTKEGPIALNFS
jgi:hypothetical protein